MTPDDLRRQLTAIRTELDLLQQRRVETMDRAAVLVQAARGSLSMTEIAHLLDLSRPTVYQLAAKPDPLD